MSLPIVTNNTKKINKDFLENIKEIYLVGGDPVPGGGLPLQGGTGPGGTPTGLFLNHISPKNIQVNKTLLEREYQNPQIKVYYQGSMVQLRTQKNILNDREYKPGVRGKAKFSIPSRRRLLQKLSMVNRDNLPVFITLTYPGQFERDPKIWKKDLDNFSKNIKYHYPEIGFFWKLEPQKRGAPHYHLMIWGLSANKNTRDYVSNTWFRIVGSGDEKHLRAGTQVKKVENWDGVRAYASKYLGKIQSFDTEFVGRYWGIRYPENIDWSEMYDWKLDIYEAINFSRVFQSYKKSVYRCKAEKLKIKLKGKTKDEKKQINKIINNLYKISRGQKSRLNDTILVNSGDFWLSAIGKIRKMSGSWSKMSYIAYKIRSLRRQNKQNQADLAGLINVSQPLIAQWESEKSIPNLLHIEKICKIYQISLSQFFEDWQGGIISNQYEYLKKY